jgi:hypothetical protein
VGWHMKKKREMANYFTSSDPNHGISRDIFWHTVWFMFQFPLLQMHRLMKLKTLTSMKLQASGRSHFGLVHDGQNYEAICMQASPNSSGVTGDCRPILTMTSPTHSYGVSIKEADTPGTMRGSSKGTHLICHKTVEHTGRWWETENARGSWSRNANGPIEVPGPKHEHLCASTCIVHVSVSAVSSLKTN